jgi:hypothetical protein
MLLFGDPIIDWSAILKIVIVALAGGVGIVVVYGFLLLGLKFATNEDGTHGEGSRITGYTLSAICGLVVIGVIVLGIYAMTQKG